MILGAKPGCLDCSSRLLEASSLHVRQTLPEAMQKLYEAGDSLEAQLLKDRLQTQRIPAVVLGDGLMGGAGELPAMVFPTVWIVESRDLVPAKRVLAEFLHARQSDSADPAWNCPSCGERVEAGFDLCWQCGTARPE